MDFRKYINDELIKPSDRVLEFGPLNWPIVSKENPNIFYSDIRNTDNIKKLYTSNDYLKSTGVSIDINTIVDIDFVINGNYKETFRNIEKFDVIILSHVIEHMPDIIYFFKDILNILKDNGRLVIVYPDARYCFDHFRIGTRFIDAYDIYKNKGSNLSSTVFDFTYNVIHENNPKFFWQDHNIINKLPLNEFDSSINIYKKALKGDFPDDVHFWPFSDYQFIKFLYDMDRADLLALEIKEFYATQDNTQEFMVVLSPKHNSNINLVKYKKIFNITSPQIKNIEAHDKIIVLTNKVEELKSQNEKLQYENKDMSIKISDVYNSKRFRFIDKIANIKNRIL